MEAMVTMFDIDSYHMGLKSGTGRVVLSGNDYSYQDDGEGNITISESGEQ